MGNKERVQSAKQSEDEQEEIREKRERREKLHHENNIKEEEKFNRQRTALLKKLGQDDIKNREELLKALRKLEDDHTKFLVDQEVARHIAIVEAEEAQQAAVERARLARVEAEDRIFQRELANLKDRNAARERLQEESIQREIDQEVQRHTETQRIQEETERLTARRERAERTAASRSIQQARRLNRELTQALSQDDRAPRIVRFFENLGNTIDRNHESIAKFDNQLRGLLTLAVFAFAQQLISALAALAGSFVAVASSAAFAAAAIGAAMTSAAAQAIPAIGLIIAAFGRIGAVFDAVQAQNKAVTQASDASSQALERQRNAANRVRDAQEGVADSQRRVRDAQIRLNEARREATRELEDMRLAEEAARLATERAEQGLDAARRARRRAVVTGDIEALAGAETAVGEAELGLTRAQREQRRTRVDVGRQRAAGVEGAEGVVGARRQLEEARRAAERASRSLREARRDAEAAAVATTGAATQLNQLLAELSGAERGLFRALLRLQERYREGFRPITDIIVRAFTRGVDRVTEIIGDPRIVRPFTRLATAIATSMDRVTSVLTSSGVLDFFAKMTEASAQSIGPLTEIGLNLFEIFRNIAEAGLPAFRILVGFFEDITATWAESTGDTDRLSRFFETGAEHAIAWAELAGAVFDLFAALAGAGGAETGLGIVEDLTKATSGAADSVRENSDAVREFFSESREILDQIARVFAKLGEEIVKSIDPEAVEAFADILIEVFIPALGRVIRTLGRATIALEKFLSVPGVGEFTQFIVAFTIFSVIISRVIGIFGVFFTTIGKALGIFARLAHALGIISIVNGEVVTSFGRFFGIIGRLLGPIAASVGAIILMIQQFGLLKTVLTILFVPFGITIGFIAALLDKIGVLDPALKFLGRTFSTMGRAIASAADAVWDAIRGSFGSVVNFLGDLPGRFFRLGRRIVSRFFDAWVGFARKVLGFYKGAFETVWDFLRSLPEEFARLGITVAKGFLNAIRDGLEEIRDSFRDLGKFIIRSILGGIKAAAHEIRDFISDLIPDPIKDALSAAGGAAGDVADFLVPGRREGGYSEGLVAASPGEMLVGPDGGVGIVPGMRQAADSVLMRVKSGTAFLTDHGQALRASGMSLMDAVSQQLPHFQTGGYVQGAREPRGPAGRWMRSVADALFRRGFNVTSGGEHRGTGTGHDQQWATDWGDSRNNLRRLWGILFPHRARTEELYGPSAFAGLYERGRRFYDRALQADHEDHIHLGVKQRIAALIGAGRGLGVADEPARRERTTSRAIRVPLFEDVPGRARRAVARLTGVEDARLAATPIGGFLGSLRASVRGLGAALTEDLATTIRIGTQRVTQQSQRPLTERDRRLGAEEFDRRGGQPLNRLTMRRLLNVAGLPNFMGFVAREESGLDPNVVNRIGASGLFQVLRGLHAGLIKRYGGDVLNMLTNARVAKHLHSASGLRPWEASRHEGHTGGWAQYIGQRFQTGGVVGGLRPRPRGVGVPLISDAFGAFEEINRLLRDVGRAAIQLGRQALPRSRNMARAIGLIGLSFSTFFDSFTAAFEAMRTDASNALRRATFQLDKNGQFIRRLLSPEQLAHLQLDELRNEYQLLLGARGALADQMRAARATLIRARRVRDPKARGEAVRAAETVIAGIEERMRTLDTAIGESVEAIGAAAEAELQSLVDSINRQAERRQARVGALGRIAGVVGGAVAGAFGIGPQQLAVQQRTIIEDQVRGLQGALDAARKQGNAPLAQQLEDQIFDLQVQMAEVAQAGLRGEIEAAGSRAQHALSRLDIRGRLADLRERAGDVQGAFAARGGILAERGEVLRAQEARLQELAVQAIAGGQFAVFEDLVVQTEDLRAQMAENTAAIETNTIAARQAAIDAITGRGSFLGGIVGGLQGIVQTIGAISGALDVPALIALARDAGDVLRETGAGLRESLFQFFGIDLRGLTGQAFVEAVRRIDFSAILARLTPEQRAQFEPLINAIIENEGAITQNTQAVQELTGQMNVQSFTSAAFRAFRQSVFTGSGGLLPQYAPLIPNFQTGGIVASTRTRIAPVGSRNGTTREQNNFYFTEPMEVADPVALGQAIVFKKSSARRT